MAALSVLRPLRPRSTADTLHVTLSSLGIAALTIGFVPLSLYIIRKKVKSRRRRLAAFLAVALVFYVGRPRRKRKDIMSWSLWEHYLHYHQVTVIDDSDGTFSPIVGKQKILAIAPHGIIPWGIALPAVSSRLQSVFGNMRAIIATATSYIPIVGHVAKSVRTVDATKSNVDLAMSTGDSLSVNPGGITEMFSAPSTKDSEFALLSDRKGYARMAVRWGVPVTPVYVFGSSRLFRRYDVPALERFSRYFKIAILFFYGRLGLPVPFPIKLLYVIGKTIRPKPVMNGGGEGELERVVEGFHDEVKKEIVDVFERNKTRYDKTWGGKRLTLI